MLKALFLDMDETLCDTNKANETAKKLFGATIESIFGSQINGQNIANDYVRGIYREWTPEQQQRYLPIIKTQNESAFRIQLILDLLAAQNITGITHDDAQRLQDQFDADRLNAFEFYPGIIDFLASARKSFTLIVITNGPEFSQIPKIESVKLTDHVDHIIIGGQEPEQKPAISIFDKALKLANCEAHEAIHIGDSLAADIAGANKSGITSVWIQHQQPLDAELGINPTHTLFHPNEIPELIESLS
jgi:HAD superfamily hydrolase (TIGR01509 family)